MAKPITVSVKQYGVREVHPSVDQLNKYAAIGLFNTRKYQTAIVTMKRAIRVTPNSRELWSNIGMFYFNVRQYAEAEAALNRALTIDADYPVSHCNLALVYGATKQFDLAEKHYAIAERLDPNYLAVPWDRSLLKLRRGDYEAGFAEYEIRIAHKPHAYPKFDAPYYAGQPLEGRSVYVMGEQGMGDTILFSRFLPWLKAQGCKQIHVCVDQQMVRLLWYYRSDELQFLPQGVPIPKVDYVIAMGSLPHFAGVSLETVPDDPGLILARIKQHAGAAGFPLPQEPRGPFPVKVGINWTGNPEQDRNEERSIPFETMLRLAEHPRVWLHSFQVGPASRDIARAGAEGMVLDLSKDLSERGLLGCGAAMLQMDLIVTSCTMTAHLAGALGVPCWVMLCNDAYWPWLLDRSDSPWYPNTRLFRQDSPDDWGGVMEDVMRALETTIERKD